MLFVHLLYFSKTQVASMFPRAGFVYHFTDNNGIKLFFSDETELIFAVVALHTK